MKNRYVGKKIKSKNKNDFDVIYIYTYTPGHWKDSIPTFSNDSKVFVRQRRFGLLQPGACHKARFMADILYLLTLNMTKSVLSVMSEKDYVRIDLLYSMSYISGMTWKHPGFF